MGAALSHEGCPSGAGRVTGKILGKVDRRVAENEDRVAVNTSEYNADTHRGNTNYWHQEKACGKNKRTGQIYREMNGAFLSAHAISFRGACAVELAKTRIA